ncbi:MAG TPA: hypothetical protein PKC43_06195 [Phycisphaerales bacterium]|nr:hypothetical protein [Phycisphaerales bacterium]
MSELLPRALRAEDNQWGDICEYIRLGHAAELVDCGLRECAGCAEPIEDIGHPDYDGGTVELADGTLLCDGCHEAAEEARAKIVVEYVEEADEWFEDRSALSHEEAEMARYLDRADEHAAYEARSWVSVCPRNERRAFCRHQDSIDIQRWLRGKTVRKDA